MGLEIGAYIEGSFPCLNNVILFFKEQLSGMDKRNSSNPMSGRSHPKIWTTKTYDRLSKYYDGFMRILFPIGEKGRDHIVEKLETGSVMDVGCGTGTLLGNASAKGLRCFGIDLSEGMLGQAKANAPNANLSIASFYDIPFPNDNFDYVVATNALSGTFIRTREVVTEMIRICREGGSVLLAEWPVAQKATIKERIIVKLASLNDDAPKDFMDISRKLGLEPEVEQLDKRYSIFIVHKV